MSTHQFTYCGRCGKIIGIVGGCDCSDLQLLAREAGDARSDRIQAQQDYVRLQAEVERLTHLLAQRSLSESGSGGSFGLGRDAVAQPGRAGMRSSCPEAQAGHDGMIPEGEASRTLANTPGKPNGGQSAACAVSGSIPDHVPPQPILDGQVRLQMSRAEAEWLLDHLMDYAASGEGRAHCSEICRGLEGALEVKP